MLGVLPKSSSNINASSIGGQGGQAVGNGYISKEMEKRIGQYSPEARRSKSFQAMQRVRNRNPHWNKQASTSVMAPKPPTAHIPPDLADVLAGMPPLKPSKAEMNILSRQSSNPMSSVTEISSLSRLGDAVNSSSLSAKLAEYERLDSEERSLNSTVNNTDQSMAPITLHFHFNGNVNEQDVRNGVEESVPMIREAFEEQLARYRHEASRRSF